MPVKKIHTLIPTSLPREAIGHYITHKVPTLSVSSTVNDARELIEYQSSEFSTVNYIYVLSKHGKLAGLLSIREVFSKNPTARLKDVMVKDLIVAHPKTDKEKVARLAIKHNIKAIPITDEHEYFLGVVSNDVILVIIDQESEENLLRLGGIMLGKVHKEEESNLPIQTTFTHRVPWILFGLVGGFVTAEIITKFDLVLKENIILASFIPLVAYVANAVGTQTQTLFIRDLAVQTKYVFSKYLVKQIAVSTLIGISCLLSVVLMTAVLWQETYIGLVVGISVLCAILTATFFALLIPNSLKKFNVDPAIGSGPFSTIVQDLLSVIIYFLIASAML